MVYFWGISVLIEKKRGTTKLGLNIIVQTVSGICRRHQDIIELKINNNKTKYMEEIAK